MKDAELAIVRAAYAKQMLALCGVANDARLEAAFAGVQRENFIGQPPWRIVNSLRGNRVEYRTLPMSCPEVVYQDVRFALACERGVNNGSPSLHARWLHEVAPQAGETVAHIGAGTGYYSAVLAHMVGSQGHVTAVEFDPNLAALAKQNLSHLSNVTVVNGDGSQWPQAQADCIYVNFSVAAPAAAWVDNLASGGRLIFPLGVPGPTQTAAGETRLTASEAVPVEATYRHTLYGATLLVSRKPAGLAANALGHAAFVYAEGPLAGSESERDALKAAFERGGLSRVKSLDWGRTRNGDDTWYAGTGWALRYEAVRNAHA